MTEFNTIDINKDIKPYTINANGHDLDTLLYSFLDECLSLFTVNYYICCDIHILNFDKVNFSITANCYGEEFSLKKHPQGTEVKAITYSNMQVFCILFIDN